MCVSNLMQIIRDTNIVLILDRDKDNVTFTGDIKDIPPEYHGDKVKGIHSEILELHISKLENVYPKYPGEIVSSISVIVIEVR